MIEMMVVLVVAGVLLGIALPAYQDSLRKGRRSDAMAALGQAQLAQERWRSNHLAYANNLDDIGVAGTSPAGHYTLSVLNSSASGYTLAATAASGSSQASDTNCASLRLSLNAGMVVYSATGTDGSYDAVDSNRCWAR